MGKVFELPRRLSPERFLKELERLGSVSSEKLPGAAAVYGDTFDWRLFAKGLALVESNEGGKSKLFLKRLPGEATLGRHGGNLPGFAREMPSSSFRTALAALSEPRMLLPLVSLRTERRRITLSDLDGKIVTRLLLETHRAAPKTAVRGRLLPRRVRVELLPGTTAGARSLLAIFRLSLRMGPPSKSLFEQAMAAAGRVPGDYSSKVTLAVDPDLTAQESLRFILRSLVQVMERNLAGTCEGRDPEFLHDFRVAVRRTRAALTQLKGVLPPARVEEFLGGFAWLQQATGPARDMDVYLLNLPGYRGSLPTREADSLGPLQKYLEEKSREGRSEVAATLGSERFIKFMTSWKSFLEEEVTAGEETPLAAVRTADLASARIWKVYRRSLAAGRGVREDSPVEELHELRKTCKKLRYLMEFFRSLYPEKSVARLTRDLKRLQDNLGDFNDLQVQSEYLEDTAGRMEREGSLGPRTFVALGRLVEGHHWRGLHEKERFWECFRIFEKKKNRRLFRKLFNARMPKGYRKPGEGGGVHGPGD